MAATTSRRPESQLAEQLLAHKPPHYTFSFTPFLQRTYQHSLPPDRPICKAYQSGQCPLKTRCPERHVTALPGGGGGGAGGGDQQQPLGGGPGTPFGSLVCKHWLRGLCKKGESCEFLHEYNLRKMPECNFFVRNGYCSNGDECLYLHVDPASKLAPCPHYDRGFCPLGPRCARRHVRRPPICPFYLAGFCPDGARRCDCGSHPRWSDGKDLEPPQAKVQRSAEEEERAREEALREREREREQREGGDRYDRGGFKDRFGGARGGGRWRGTGRAGTPRFRGRGH